MESQFQDLKPSTKTIMVYCNVKFNLQILFNNLPIISINVPLTKKKKLPNMKKAVAPAKSIISVRYGNEFRGITTKKINDTNGKEYFKNQVSCTISIGEKNLHIMIFNSSSKNSSIKIAGSNLIEQSIDVIKILWEYIKNIEGSYKITDDKPLTFIFDSVMSNVDFKLGFRIDRKVLNNIMNDEKYKDIVYMSMFESTSNPNVNIKFYCKKPENLEYKCLIIQTKGKNETYKVDVTKENPYRDKKDKSAYTTFLVFGSSKVIESGRYELSMNNSFNDFINIIKENKEKIEEKIEDTIKYEE